MFFEEPFPRCNICNTRNRLRAKFCRHCGKSFTGSKPKEELKQDEFACCPRCKETIKKASKFCSKCGFNIERFNLSIKSGRAVFSAPDTVSGSKKTSLGSSEELQNILLLFSSLKESYGVEIEDLSGLLKSQKYFFENEEKSMALINGFTGKIITANSSFESFFGYKKKDLRKKNIASLFFELNSHNKKYDLKAILSKPEIFIFNRDFERFSVRLKGDMENVEGKLISVIIDDSLEAEKKLFKRERGATTKKLFLLGKIVEEINSSLDIEVILNNTLERLMVFTKSEAALIMFLDENKMLRPIVSRGISKEFIDDLKGRIIRPDKGTRGKALLLGKSVEVSHTEEESFLTGSLLNKEQLKTIVTVPLKTKDEVIGIMSLGRRKKESYAGKELELLDAIGSHVVIAIKNSRLHEQVKERYQALVSQLPDLVMVLKDNIILYVNPVVKDILGYDCEELVNNSIIDYVVEKDRISAHENLKNTVTGRNHGDYEIEIFTKKGKKRKTIIRSSLITYENWPAVLSVFIDITDIRKAEEELRERTSELDKRVKEITCLYGIARLVAMEELSIEEILRDTVKLLSTSWYYKDFLAVKIIMDGKVFETEDFPSDSRVYSWNIVVDDVKRGTVNIVFPGADVAEDTILYESDELIRMVIREITHLVEIREAAEIRAQLQEKLKHADRLATIGKLSAGVAHELNEPLGNILGFAQLTKKACDLPSQIEKDIDKIEAASLYAREVVRKLMLFARQMPQKKKEVDLNQVVNEALYLFEARCEKKRNKIGTFLYS